MPNELKPCPFCGGAIRIAVCDDEGNTHDADYENNAWSGLGYQLYHDIADVPEDEECPIARLVGEGVMGAWIYDTREEAVEACNRRVDNDRQR